MKAWLYALMMRFWPHVDIYQDALCDVCQKAGFEWPEEWSHCPFCLGGYRKKLYLRCFYIWRSRWTERLFGFKTGSIYLHQFLSSDNDPDPHDHSWWFCSILLKGSYRNEVWTTWADGSWRPIAGMLRDGEHGTRVKLYRPELVHRVLLEDEKPCWTLMITGRVKRDFHFYTKNGPVVWWKYLGFKEKP